MSLFTLIDLRIPTHKSRVCAGAKEWIGRSRQRAEKLPT